GVWREQRLNACPKFVWEEWLRHDQALSSRANVVRPPDGIQCKLRARPVILGALNTRGLSLETADDPLQPLWIQKITEVVASDRAQRACWPATRGQASHAGHGHGHAVDLKAKADSSGRRAPKYPLHAWHVSRESKKEPNVA